MNKRSLNSKGMMYCLLAGLVLLSVVVIVLLIVAYTGDEARQADHAAESKSPLPDYVGHVVQTPEPTSGGSPAPVAATPAPKPEPKHAVTNRNGKVIAISDEEWAKFEAAKKDTTLRTRTEKQLRLLASVRPGTPVPPMPGNPADIDADIEATLNNEIEILPDDSEKEIEYKKFVMDFKEYMREEMAKGKKASEAYQAYIDLMNEVAEVTTQGTRMVRELLNAGNEEEANQMLEKINAKLESLGADPIDLNRRPRGVAKQGE